VLILLLFPDLGDLLGDAKWFAENFFPFWAIQDWVFTLKIYDWRVRSDFTGIVDIVGNLYRLGCSLIFQGMTLFICFELFKKSKSRLKTALRLILSTPLVFLFFESVIAFVLTFLFIQGVLIGYLGHAGSFLATIFLVIPLIGVVLGSLWGILYFFLEKIWANEEKT
jgi:hypothetical protein